jgi:nitrilase
MSFSETPPKFIAAAVQAAPVLRDAPDYFDTPATLAKAVGLIREADANQAKLVVFPEGWLPCFTYWTLDLAERMAFRDIWVAYLRSSIEVPGPETDALCEAARETGACVVMGINERDKHYSARMYNSILYIGPDGKILGVHRKICNTAHERFFHTPGDGGDNLKTVFQTPFGKIGGSICGEHTQLALEYYWIMQGIQVHCSLWPGSTGMENISDVMTRAMCFASGAYGVLAATYIPDAALPKNFYANSTFSQPGSFNGGSGIISPYGAYITGPVYAQETLVYGEIDLAEIPRSRYAVNLTGIYSRWDLLGVNVRETGYSPVTSMPDPGVGDVTDIEARLARIEALLAGGSQAGTPAADGE